MGAERRESPRVIVDPPLRARVVGPDADVSIVDVSFGGFRVHSGIAFEQGAELEFLVFPRSGGEVMHIDATATHCRVLSTEPTVLFETGFAFADSAWTTVGFQALIDSVLCGLETY
jgi:hypothetical protein